MRTNRVNQELSNNAVSLPSDSYRGEFFNDPVNAIEGEVIYKMAYLQIPSRFR